MPNSGKSEAQLAEEYNQRLSINNAFRRLWVDQVIWIQEYMADFFENSNNIDYVRERLYRNPAQIADEFEKYYDTQTALTLKQLLEKHLDLTIELADKIKSKDISSIYMVRYNWFKNADEIAEFLTSINPYWDKRLWTSLLTSYLQKIEQLITIYQNRQYRLAVSTYDELLTIARDMGVVTADGIIKQLNL